MNGMRSTPVSLRFPHRRWFVRRVTERGSWWLYFAGGRFTLFRYHGLGRMLCLYVTTKRLNVNWRIRGGYR